MSAADVKVACTVFLGLVANLKHRVRILTLALRPRLPPTLHFFERVSRARVRKVARVDWLARRISKFFVLLIAPTELFSVIVQARLSSNYDALGWHRLDNHSLRHCHFKDRHVRAQMHVLLVVLIEHCRL